MYPWSLLGVCQLPLFLRLTVSRQSTTALQNMPQGGFFAFFFFMISIELHRDLEKEEVKNEGHFCHDLLRLN